MFSNADKRLKYDTFRRNLSNLINLRKITQVKLADDIGCTKGTVSRYLNSDREPEIEFVYRIAEYFGVTIDWLLGIAPKSQSRFTPETEQIATLYQKASPSDKAVVQTLLQKYETDE